MPGLTDVYSSPRPITLLTAEILDADAIKASVATVTTAASYSGAALDGADVDGTTHIATPTPTNTGQVVTGVPQYPVAVGAGAGAFVDASEVVFTGTYGGVSVTRTATVSGTDGGTFIADGPLDTVNQIDVDAQADTDGTWTFGFTDIGCWRKYGVDKCFRAIRANAAGNMHLADEDGNTDLTPFVSGEFQPVGVPRIIQATTTVTQFTIYR